jgi:peptidoglycan/LPS O-acetylase OafA/YrhL
MFLKRRFARLYPVHFVMTLVLLLFAIVRLVAHKLGVGTLEAGEILPFSSGAPETLGSLISNLTLTQSLGLHDSLTYNVPAWTISVELAAYFVFVAMCLLAPPKKVVHFLSIGVGVAAIYVGLALVKPDMDITHDLGFWRCLAGFNVGVLCAWGRPFLAEWTQDMSRAMCTGIEILTALGFAAFVIWLPGKGQFLVGVFAFLFVSVFAQDRGAVSAFLSYGVFRYLAKISYSVYMVHFIIALVFGVIATQIFPQALMSVAFAGDLLLVVYMGVVIVAGHILHHWVEVPGAAWMKARLRVRARAGLQAL